MADYTKTQGTEILSHQAVTHPATVVGATQDVSAKISARVYMFHALVEAVANTNPGTFYVQSSASSANNEHWATEALFTTNTDTPATEALTATEAAAETVLAVASTSGFAAGDVVYIQDTGTLANSEWGRIDRIVTNVSIDLVDGLTNGKDSADFIWGSAQVFMTALDLSSVGRLRVIYQHRGAAAANSHVQAIMVTADSIE